MPPPVNKGSKKALNVSTVNQSMKKSVVGQSRFGRSVISSRTALSSSSKKTLAETDRRQVRAPVQVFDEAGQDVTPLPLVTGIDGANAKKGSNIMGDSSGGTPTDLMSSVSIYQTGTVSTYGGGPFTRSVFSTSQSEKSSESIGDDMAEPGADMSSAWADVRTQREEQAKEDLSESELDHKVSINLTETDTIWLLDMPGVSISAESEESLPIKERNEKYRALLKSRVGNDLYVERSMNTFNDPPKLKMIQTDKIGHNDVGVSASCWDMFDTYEAIRLKAEKEKQEEEEALLTAPAPTGENQDGDEEKVDDAEAGSDPTKSRLESRGTEASVAESDRDSIFISTNKDSSVAPAGQAELDLKILKSDALRQHLFIMERAVNLNTYQAKLALYRGFEIMPDIDKIKVEEAGEESPTPAPKQIAVTDMGPNLDRLWSYHCMLLKGRNVSCMAWNKVNADLLAVGYGQYEFSGQKAGMICCWSLKNPEYPERVYTSKAGVTSMDFSMTNPNLLAVGFYDGTVAIYNVRTNLDEAMLDSFETQGKHTGPVWHLKWIERERGSGDERAEILVSASTDGRITQWSIRKGFECSDLMKLKRVPVKHSGLRGKEKKIDALIQRYAGGFCFDFSPVESNIYLAGTEEGHVHKCSCSYNEQFLDTYLGHTGPVYQVSWSPFVSDVFLSCSADWTVILWHENRQTPVISFHSSTKAVHGICWSPKSSTVFACVNEGSVEVWDLNQSTLDPIIVTSPVTGAKLSTVAFARNSDSLLVGDSAGQVTVYELRCMPEPPTDQAEALTSIIQTSLASQLQNAPR